MPTIILRIDTGFVGASHHDEIEVDDDEWAAMSEKERDEYCEEALQDFLGGRIDASYEVKP